MGGPLYTYSWGSPGVGMLGLLNEGKLGLPKGCPEVGGLLFCILLYV